MKITKHPDGTSYVNPQEFTNLTRTFRINSYTDLWHLKQYVDAFRSKVGARPRIMIPNLLDAQADRRFSEDESFGLKLVLQDLVRMEANFEIFHPHNPEVVEMAFEMFDKKVTIMDNWSFIDQVLIGMWESAESRKIRKNDISDNLVLMSSDAGGYKPLMKLCNRLGWKGDTLSAAKSRTYKDGQSVLTQILPVTDLKGKDVLIIDDISVYGGTFKGLSKLLDEANVGKKYLAVSHMTIKVLNKDNVCNYFDKVYTTNSKFDTYYIDDYEGLGILNAAPKNLEILKFF